MYSRGEAPFVSSCRFPFKGMSLSARVPAACAIIIPLLVIESAARSFLCLPDITGPFCCVQGNVSLSDQIRRNISSFLLLIDK